LFIFVQEDAGTSLKVTGEQLRLVIAEYNAANPSGLDMTLVSILSCIRYI
jgi:hypothetical protein